MKERSKLVTTTIITCVLHTFTNKILENKRRKKQAKKHTTRPKHYYTTRKVNKRASMQKILPPTN